MQKRVSRRFGQFSNTTNMAGLIALPSNKALGFCFDNAA